MSGSDPKPFEVAESSPLRVLWVVLPLLAAFVACGVCNYNLADKFSFVKNVVKIISFHN